MCCFFVVMYNTFPLSGVVVSSDEDEDDIFSDDLVERGSDSESGDNEPVSN